MSPEGVAYRYKELYGCKKGEANVGLKWTPSQIGNALAEWLEPEFRDGIRFQGIADPAIFDESRGESVEAQLRKTFTGVIFRKADNTRYAGKMNFHEYLKFDENGQPKLQVFNTCNDFIRTIPTLVYDDHDVEDIDTDGEDHIYDESRYYLMERPLTVRIDHKKPESNIWTPFDDKKRRRR